MRLKPDDVIDPLLKDGRATISLGYIGLHEVGVWYEGLDESTPTSVDFFRRTVVAYLYDLCSDWYHESGYGFSVYATPSESLCDRFYKLDREYFGEVEGITDHGYYTNSFHTDVRERLSVYRKIEKERWFPQFSSGGFITFAEFPPLTHNLDALENVWNYAYKRIPYFGTNTPIDQCFLCGFKGEALATNTGYQCPECGNHDSSSMSVTKRVCGYLGAPDARPFNPGKQQETINRVKHL